jgi:hypothetical protein
MFYRYPKNNQKCYVHKKGKGRYFPAWEEGIMVTDARRHPIETAKPVDRIGHMAQSSQ